MDRSRAGVAEVMAVVVALVGGLTKVPNFPAIGRRNGGWNGQMSHRKNPGWLGYIGDEILPSYIGIIWDYDKPSLTDQDSMESRRVFSVATGAEKTREQATNWATTMACNSASMLVVEEAPNQSGRASFVQTAPHKQPANSVSPGDGADDCLDLPGNEVAGARVVSVPHGSIATNSDNNVWVGRRRVVDDVKTISLFEEMSKHV